MVTIHPNASADAEGVENRTQLLHDLGCLIALWSEMELHIEVAIAKLAKLDFHRASIILGTLQNSAKTEILYALLKLAGNDETVQKIQTAIAYAKRNALVHGMVASEDDFSDFVFYKRQIKGGYKVTKNSFTANSFRKHVWKFTDLAHEALGYLNVTPEEVLEYGRHAKFDGIAQA